MAFSRLLLTPFLFPVHLAYFDALVGRLLRALVGRLLTAYDAPSERVLTLFRANFLRFAPCDSCPFEIDF